MESMFARGTERWNAEVGGSCIPVSYDALSQAVTVSAPDRDNVYFVAPGRFPSVDKHRIRRYSH